MIPITQHEADHLIAHVPTRKLKKASERKNYGGKTYYLLCDDDDSMKTVAMLRGYAPIKTTIVGEHGKPKEKIISPVEQLYRDN